MAKRQIQVGSTDQTIDVFVADSSSATGAGLTGLVFNSSGLTCYYRKGATGAVTQLTLATQTVGGAHSDGGFVELSSTNMPGMYRLDLSDTMVASAGMLTVMLKGAANMAPLPLEIEVVDFAPTGQSAIDLKDFADAGYDPATNKVQGVVLVDTLTTYTGNTPQTGDAFARLGAPAGASVSADILTIDNLVDDLESRLGTPSNLGSGATVAANLADIESQTDDIGAAGAGLTAVPWNAAWDAEVQSEVDDALVAHRLDELLNADSDIDGAAPPTVGSVFFELLTKTTGSFTYDQTTDSLEAIRDRGDAAWVTSTLTAGAVADAVWDEAIAGHLSAGSTGAALNAAGSAGDPWSTPLPGAYGAGTAGKIIGDNLNATVSSRSSHSAADVWAVATRVLTAGTNIVLAKGTGVTGFTDLSAAQVSAAVWDEDATGHQTQGTFGQAVGDPGATAVSIWNRVTTALPTAAPGGTNGLWILGENTAASGVVIQATSGTALTLEANSSGHGLFCSGAGLGSGIAADGGNNAGFLAFATNAGGVGMRIQGETTDVELVNSTAPTLRDAIWTGGTRTITSLDEDTVTLDLDATIRAAVGLASANLDTQLDALPTANENADAYLDRANGVETGLTPRQAMRLGAAADSGKLSGAATTTINIRDVNDTKNRITATVDADGNRTAVTRDVT